MNSNTNQIYNKAFDVVKPTLVKNGEIYPFVITKNEGTYQNARLCSEPKRFN